MSKRQNPLATFRCRLYVAGAAINSAHAVANLQAICRAQLLNRLKFEVELVDVLADPERALEDGVIMTPTLIKLSPLPVRRIVGSLSDTATVLHALGIRAPFVT